jgi:hypothetical protein
VTEIPTITSPAAIRGSQLFFWASLPPWSSALVRISGRVIRERRARELLGGEDHGEIAELRAPIGLGHRQSEVAELGHLRDEGLRDERVAAMDPLRLRRHLAIGELAHRLAHLLRELVERQPIATARGRHLAPDLAQHGLAAGAAQAVPHTRREGVFQRGLVQPELEQHAVDPLAQAAHELRHAGGGEGLEPLAAASVAGGFDCEVEQRPGGPALGGGIGHALGEHLVGVDLVPMRGDLPRAHERLRDQALGGGEQQAGVVETGAGGHRIPLTGERPFREKSGRLG